MEEGDEVELEFDESDFDEGEDFFDTEGMNQDEEEDADDDAEHDSSRRVNLGIRVSLQCVEVQAH